MNKSIVRYFVIPIIIISLFGCVRADAKTFSDVRPSDWYYETVTYMTGKGILSGYADGSFKPKESITTAEYISILCRIKGLEPATGETGHWALPLMKSALTAGWYDYDENPPTGEKFDKPIERQLAVKILVKAFAKGDLSYDYNTESAKIKDFSALSGRYYDTVLFAYKEGLVKGNSEGRFEPYSYLSRAEACTLIKNALDKYGEDKYIKPGENTAEETPTAAPVITGGISRNGNLKVSGTRLVNEKGEAVVLRGMSTHGLQWFPGFISDAYIKAAAYKGANVMRFAMYTEEGGYIQDPSVKNTLEAGVKNAVSNDMYAIIDWHILSDGNPMTHIAEAKAFFSDMSLKYKDTKGIIYEICNEPNGNISWSENVKPYAEEIISTIRANDSDAVILVGSPTWSQDIDKAAADRIDGENIMYTCHFYAGAHTQWLRDRIKAALSAGLPIFVSEWGTSDASGSGGVFEEESLKWLDFMQQNGISWCNWSYCDKQETSAALQPGGDPSDGISENELTPSGKIVFSHFK